MTETEIKDWIKTVTFVTTDYCETDSDGCNYARDIFQKDGKFFAVEYINGKILDQLRLVEGAWRNTGYYYPKAVKALQKDPETILYVDA